MGAAAGPLLIVLALLALVAGGTLFVLALACAAAVEPLAMRMRGAASRRMLRRPAARLGDAAGKGRA